MNKIPILSTKPLFEEKYSLIFCDNENIYLVSKNTKTIDKYNERFELIESFGFESNIKSVCYVYGNKSFFAITNDDNANIISFDEKFIKNKVKDLKLNFTPNHISYNKDADCIILRTDDNKIELDKNNIKPIKNNKNQFNRNINNLAEFLDFKDKNNIILDGFDKFEIVDVCYFKDCLYFLVREGNKVSLVVYNVSNLNEYQRINTLVSDFTENSKEKELLTSLFKSNPIIDFSEKLDINSNLNIFEDCEIDKKNDIFNKHDDIIIDNFYKQEDKCHFEKKHNDCKDECHSNCEDKHNCNEKEKCCLKDNCCDVIHSIALIETSLAHILNSEGEKIQKAVKCSNSICEILDVNNSVIEMIDKVIKLETLLFDKLKVIEKIYPKDLCKETKKDFAD